MYRVQHLSRFYTPGANHDVKIFDDLPRGELKDETEPLPPYFHLPSARRTYLGRINVYVSLTEENALCFRVCVDHGYVE